MVKGWVSYLELQTEAKLRVMNDQGKFYPVERLRSGHL